MNIRPANSTDRAALFDIWLRCVRATHHFHSEDDIQSLSPHVRDFLGSNDVEFWVLTSHAGVLMGFMAMAGSKIEAMFLSPEFFRQGGGRLLVEHARSLHDGLTVDVNEQNSAACRFYEACGFVADGRSEVDDAGRAFPLVHMRLKKEPRID
jgi:putative acetyltransferase